MSWIFSRALINSLTNSPYSQGLEADSTQLKNADTESSAPLSVMPTPHKFWRNDKTMEFSRLSQFGLTCQLLTQDHGEALLTSFLAGFPAKISVQLERAQALTESEADSGQSLPGSFAIFVPSASKWKTVQCSLLGDLIKFSETWPRSGMMRNGVVYQRKTLMRGMNVKEFGLWPTPTVCGNYNRKGASPTSGDGLHTAVVKRMYPTPTAHNAKEGGFPAEFNRNTPTLAAQASLGGPIGPLNPTWTEWLMGWPSGATDLKPLEMDKFLEWRRQHSINWATISE